MFGFRFSLPLTCMIAGVGKTTFCKRDDRDHLHHESFCLASNSAVGISRDYNLRCDSKLAHGSEGQPLTHSAITQLV